MNKGTKNALIAGICITTFAALMMIVWPKLDAAHPVKASSSDADNQSNIDEFEAAIAGINIDDAQIDDLVRSYFPDAETITYTDESGNSVSVPFVELNWNTIGQGEITQNRVKSAMNKGLADQEISDAASFCYSKLTSTDIQTIRFAQMGETFAVSDVARLKEELCKELLANPPLLLSYVETVLPMKMGDSKTIGELSTPLSEFVGTYQAALAGNGRGANIWIICRTSDQAYGMTREYLKYALTYIELLNRCGLSTARLEVVNHYHLVGITEPSMTRLTISDYVENLPSLVFTFYLKDGTAAVKFGSNLLDKRPEVLKDPEPAPEVTTEASTTKSTATTAGGDSSTTTSKKKKTPPKETTPSVTTTVTTETTPEPETTPETETTTVPPTTVTGHKDPADDPANNGNANVGGGSNDTNSAGEEESTPAVTKSKSDSVIGFSACHKS